MSVNISLIYRGASNRSISGHVLPSRLRIDLNPTESTEDLKRRIAERLSLNLTQVRLILAGQTVSDNVSLESLSIGPSTVIHALVCELEVLPMSIPSVTQTAASNQNSSGWRSTFYVYCKSCDRVQPGKLRLRCSQCKSTAVLLQREPDCWNDVLSPNNLTCECTENNCQHCFGQFLFKCVPCSEASTETVGAVLPQITSNINNMPCSTCNDVLNPIINFFCDHVMCMDCFVAYASCSLPERRFRIVEPYGYTLTCPVFGCNGCIRDGHHFHLLGTELYEKYQRDATQTLILGQNGLFCPRPHCGAGFLVDSDALGQQKLIICPECGFSFCRYCRFSACECSCDGGENAYDQNDNNESSSPTNTRQLSLMTIQNTTKKCAGCTVSTEKSGGCNHMSCWQCGKQWCWVCLTEWNDDCQWDHWFEE